MVRALREVALYLRIRGDTQFKARAYERAADTLAAIGPELEAQVAAGTLTSLPGIGASIERMVTEHVRTGQSRYRDELAAEFPPGLLELARIPTLAPRKLQTLWKKLGVTSLDELERACREGRLAETSGLGPALQRQLLEAVAAHRRSGGHRLPIGDALELTETLLELLRERRGVSRVEAAGAVRRFEEVVDRIDLVAAARTPGPVLEAFAGSAPVSEELSRTERVAEVRLWEGELHASLEVVEPRAFAAVWHARTGSIAHRARLAAIAERKGLTLVDDGLLDAQGKPLPLPDEAALYAALGLPFIAPELRTDGEELDAAARGELPRLIERGDVQGLVHNHTLWSDGRDTIEAMANAALDRGFHYLTLTDHSPTASYAGGLDADRLLRQWDEVDRVNAKLRGFHILKGTESDILPDGNLDYPEELLARCDVVVGSIHARHRMDEAAMTARILGALDSPYLHVLGHLTGRLILRREPYAIRVDEIFEKAAKNGVAIEINGSPDRLDLSAALVRRALSFGVKLVVSTDAHSTRELDNLDTAVATARKGWATAADVLNTRGEEAFLAALRKPRR